MQNSSPQLMLQKRTSNLSDDWGPNCPLFEMQSGFSLFESWLGYDSYVLEEMVRTLRKRLKSWWSTSEQPGVSVKEEEECEKVASVSRSEEYLQMMNDR